ncbi:MAG TPA: hypothetical protein VGC34_00195, partial [Steroidobacteraceae bacterium]
GSVAGNAIRARHRERVTGRLRGGEELDRVLTKQAATLREGALADSKRRASDSKQIRWGALTREERNEKRRERYSARRALERLDDAGEAKRREAARLSARVRARRNPEAARETRRQWRKEHAQEINRKQREYRKKHAAELNAKRREDRRRRTAAERSLSKSPSPTADESARNWKAYRDTHGPGPTADESARNWLAFRERQRLSEPSQSSEPRARQQELVRSAPDDDADTERKPQRQRDHDYGL